MAIPATAGVRTQGGVAFNSCRNRHCPKCQWSTAAAWLAAREAELLPVQYIHLVFTLPAELGAIAYQNKARIYGLLLKAAAESLITFAADPKRLGATIAITAVLHTWGQHHPHAHCIVPAGGISPDGKHWIACKPRCFRPDLLSRLFRRLFLDYLTAAFAAGELRFFSDLDRLNEPRAFAATLARLKAINWAVHAKRPLAGPRQVLAYLARYAHRVAITNDRLLALDETHGSFRWKDYQEAGNYKSKVIEWGSPSSSAAFCSTSYRTDSTGFVTMASSPMVIAPRSSRFAEAY